ncbi:MAG: hypothetical protein K0S23_1343 [Fluviicola sp.]|jgi:hypothetical protein|uniref:hypothetical protein n=1 Tax=Fluviicola sp. TaxID=1917219 RepID=UPI00262E3CA5|nr:hypothetical protein [Fluviicola sp.]MDF3027036.1 hypothetical protein [Fluviicola sp.]
MNDLSVNDEFEKNKEWKDSLLQASGLAQKYILQNIPIYGPIIHDILNFQSDVKTKRALSFLDDLITKIRSEFGEDFNFDNLKNESFSDLLDQVLKKVENTKSEFKKDRYRDILLLKIKIDTDHLLFMKFVDLLDKVNEIQIILIQELAQNEQFELGIGLHKSYTILESYVNLHSTKPSFPGDSLNEYATKDKNGEIEFYMLELASLGLIKEISRKTAPRGTSTSKYIVTDICRKFLTFIIKK